MASQVISFRFNDDEQSRLQALALEGESLNQTAQRVLREALGMSTRKHTAVDVDSRIQEAIAPLAERLAALEGKQAA
jgi:predicted transcriptional regulator